jgi:hypothetical protein
MEIFIKNLLHEPVFILILVLFGLAVVLPWLKSKAEKTPAVLDDKIITLLELWLKTIAGKFMHRGLIIILAAIPFLSGCMFTGYGVNYDSGVWLRITAATDGKKIIIETTLNESDLGTIETITQSAMDSVK